MVAGEWRESGERNIREGSWELMEAEGMVGGLPAGQGGGPPPPPPSTGPVMKSRKSLSYSRCRSVAFQVVEVESIVLFPPLSDRRSRLCHNASIFPPLRFFSFCIILHTGLVAAVQSPASKPPLKVQRSPSPTYGSQTEAIPDSSRSIHCCQKGLRGHLTIPCTHWMSNVSHYQHLS